MGGTAVVGRAGPEVEAIGGTDFVGLYELTARRIQLVLDVGCGVAAGAAAEAFPIFLQLGRGRRGAVLLEQGPA